MVRLVAGAAAAAGFPGDGCLRFSSRPGSLVGCDLYALLDWLVDTVGSLGYAECMTLTIPSTMHWSIDSMKQGILADLLIPFNNENLLAKVQEAVARKEIEETTKNAFTSSETRILHGVGDLC